MGDFKAIIKSHYELMNSNYYNETLNFPENQEKEERNNYLLPPFFFSIDINVGYNKELYTMIQTSFDRKIVFLIIKRNFLQIYGGFASLYIECYDQENQSEYWYSESMNNSTWENPYIILCCFIDNNINPQLIPTSIQSCEDNRHIFITFSNQTSLYIDKTTKEIKEKIEEINPENVIEKEENEEALKEYALTNNLKNDFIKESMEKAKKNTNTEEIKEEVFTSQQKVENDIQAFKTLLQEKDITLMTPYDRIELLIKSDQRYKAISSNELKYSLFKEYQNTLQQSLNKNKQITAVRQQQIKAYKILLKTSIESSELTLTTTFSEFAEKHESDPTFTCMNDIDKEFFFNEVKLRLKKLYEDNKKGLSNAFISFLSSKYPIEKITSQTTVDHIKSAVKSYKEYLIIPSKTERTQAMTDYLTKMKALITVKNPSMSIVKSPNDNLVNSLQKEYDIREFNRMLSDNIQYEMCWEEVANRLDKDSRWINIEETNKKELFKEYMSNMILRHKNNYKQLLEDKIGLNEEITWHEAQHLMQKDPKYRNVQERDREELFNEYRADMLNRIMGQFELLIDERNDIVTKDSPTEGVLYDDLVNKLNIDYRAQRMLRHRDKRDKLLRGKIKTMKYKYDKAQREQRKLQQNKHNEKKQDLMQEQWEKGHIIK